MGILKDSHRFWDYLKSLKERQNTSSNEHDFPVNKLFGYFQNLHSPIDLLLSLSSDHNTLEEDISTSEETKAASNVLDNTILPAEIESITKLLGSKKAPGPDKIRNEMIKAGIQYLKTALCKLLTSLLKVGFSLSSSCTAFSQAFAVNWPRRNIEA